MEESDPAMNLSDTLIALAEAANTDDVAQVSEAIVATARAGASVRDVVEILRPSEWRYVALRTGRICDVESRAGLLDTYRGLLDQIKEAIGHFPGSGLPLHELEMRETLGQHCFELCAQARRADRYLLDTDPVLDPVEDVRRLFEGTGLFWDGEQVVEKFAGEREILLEDGKRFAFAVY